MSGAIVLVTGGTGGIGAATVAKLAQAGFRPAIGYRTNRAAAEELAQMHGGTAVALDMLDGGQIDAAVESFVGQPLVAVVLNASPAPDVGPFSKVTPASFEDHFRVSVVGNHRLLAGLIAKVFRPRKTGTVVGVLTKAMGLDGEPVLGQVTSYLSAKYGLLGILKAAQAEYAWLNVQTVSPGFTDTSMLQAFGDRFADLLREKGVVATPQDAAAAILESIGS